MLNKFPRRIYFAPRSKIHGNSILLHGNKVNLTNYTIESITGYAFAKRMHRKVRAQKQKKVSQYLQNFFFQKLDRYDPIEKTFDIK